MVDHLEDSNGHMNCPICSAGAEIVLRDHPGYQEPDVFDIARCAHCNTSFVPADGIDLDRLYERIYRQAGRIPTYFNYARRARAVLKASSPLDFLAGQEQTFWGIREYLRTSGIPQNASLLEVGSGFGYLTFALNKSGFDTTGLEISGPAVAKAKQRYGERYVCANLIDYAEAHGGRYDVVVMTEVIEHLREIYPFLGACLRLLKPGGALVVTTPNREAWPADVLWDVEAPPVHLWWFSKQSFEAMAARLSCSLSFVDLGGFPGSVAWRKPRVGEAPPVSQTPTLDRLGNVLPHKRLTPLPVRALSKFVRILKGAPASVVEEAERGPSPTLCAVLKPSS